MRSGTESIPVPFSGDGAGRGDLSWGQQEIWRSMTAVGASLTLGASFPAAPGMTVDGIAAMLATIMSRHPSMRTRITVAADGTPSQHVASEGEATLHVVHAGAADADAEAARVLEHYERTIFDYPNEWPVRMAVVVVDGVPAQVIVAYSHVAADIHGLDALVADLAAPSAEPGLPPLAQVELQRTPAARRENATALRHAAKVLRAIPSRRFGVSADPREPRWFQIGYHSPASYPAVHVIAARTGVRTTPVLLAGFAVALCKITGTDTAATRLMVNNRFRPGFATSVSPLAQSSVAAIEVAGHTFDEVVMAAWRTSTLAGRYSYFDPARMAELVDEIGRERDADVRVDVVFNDRRRAHIDTAPLGPPPTTGDVEALRERSVVRWERPLDNYDHTVFFHVNDVPDVFDYLLCADTHRLSPADMEAMVRHVEDVFVRAMSNSELKL